MKRVVAVLLLTLPLSGCGYILRAVTGEDTPHCDPKCKKPAVCQWTWTECSGPFATSCHHSQDAVCR